MPYVVAGKNGKSYTFDDEQAILIRRMCTRIEELRLLATGRKEAVISVLMATLDRVTTESLAKDEQIIRLEEEIESLKEAANQAMPVVDTVIKYLDS